MKKWNYKICVFVCMCCVADLGAAANSKGYDVSGDVALEGGVVCLSQKPLDDSDTRERGTGSVLHVEDKHQSDDDRRDAGPYVEKYISTIFGSCSSTKDLTITYKEMLTGKKHQFCFSKEEQCPHHFLSTSKDNVRARFQLFTWDLVYKCLLQNVYEDRAFPSGYGMPRCFASDHMESVLQSMCRRLEGLVNDRGSHRCEEAADLWNYKNFWLDVSGRKRVWKRVGHSTEFPHGCVRVMVGSIILEGAFVDKKHSPNNPYHSKKSMFSVMWADFCSKEMPQTKKAVKPHE